MWWTPPPPLQFDCGGNVLLLKISASTIDPYGKALFKGWCQFLNFISKTFLFLIHHFCWLFSLFLMNLFQWLCFNKYYPPYFFHYVKIDLGSQSPSKICKNCRSLQCKSIFLSFWLKTWWGLCLKRKPRSVLLYFVRKKKLSIINLFIINIFSAFKCYF